MNIQLDGFLQQSFFLATPIVLASLGGLLSERAGVFALGLEGFMLVGSFSSIWASDMTGSLEIGLLAAILAGSVFAALFASATISFGANQILTAVAMNILALGLTTYLARLAWGFGASPVVRVGGRIPIPGLSEIPFVGGALFGQPILTYVSYCLTMGLAIMLARTKWGLVIKATGENAAAADTAGFSVWKVRYSCVLLSGALASLGGASLALSQAQTFTNGMSGGRGFVALTAAVFGRWNPIATFGTSTFFGLVDALQLRLQISLAGGSSYLIQAIPPLIAIIAIAVAGKASRYPSDIGVPYRREE